MPKSLPTDDQVASRLSRVLKLQDFFPEFKGEHARKLFPRSGLYSYAKDDPIIVQDEPGRDLFVIQWGQVRVTKTFGSAAMDVTTLGTGDIFGEIGLVKDGVRMATVTATEESGVYRLAFDDVQYILKNNAVLGAHLQSLATRRLKGE